MRQDKLKLTLEVKGAYYMYTFTLEVNFKRTGTGSTFWVGTFECPVQISKYASNHLLETYNFSTYYSDESALAAVLNALEDIEEWAANNEAELYSR